MKKGLKYDFTISAVLLIPLAVAMNIIIGELATALRLPVYLDTIGTIILGMLCGPWVGMIGGFLTNLVLGLLNPVNFAYIPVSMVVGLTVGCLSNWGMYQAKWKTLLSSLVLIAAAIPVSLFITIKLFGGLSGSATDVITAAFLTAGYSMPRAVLFTNLITESVDKTLSTFIAYFIVNKLSDSYLSKLSYGIQYISRFKKEKKVEIYGTN